MGSIEFDESSVEEVVDYCGRIKPLLHAPSLLCAISRELCMREQKTYVSIMDVTEAQDRIMRTSGESNFAHYWNDNPTLDEAEHETLSAHTCLALAVISHLGGRFERIEDFLDTQREMGLGASERLLRGDVDKMVSLLVNRRVLARNASDGVTTHPPLRRGRSRLRVRRGRCGLPGRGCSRSRPWTGDSWRFCSRPWRRRRFGSSRTPSA